MYRIAKLHFFTVLIFTVVLGLVSFIPPLRSIFFDIAIAFTEFVTNSPATHYVSIGLTLLVPLLIVALSAGIAALIHLTIRIIKRKHIPSDQQEEKRGELFFLFFGLCGVAALFLMFVFLLILSRLNILEDKTDEDGFIAVSNLIVWVIIILSAANAALITGGKKLWKDSKGIASMLFVLAAIGFSTTLVAIPILHSIRTYYSDSSDYYYTNEAEESDYDQSDYDDEEEYEENYLSYLWDDPSNDTSNVSSGLRYLLKKLSIADDNDVSEPFTNYIISQWSWLKDIDEEYVDEDDLASFSYFSTIYHNLQANSDVLLSSFLSYQNLIYDQISSDTYYQTGLSNIIRALHTSYNDLYGEDSDKPQRLAKLMNSNLYSNSWDYFEDIKLFASNDAQKFFTEEGELNSTLLIWSYSFWVRRDMEGTTDVCYQILQRIMEHYEDYPYDYEGDDDEGDY